MNYIYLIIRLGQLMQTNTTASQPPKLLDQVREKIRYKHYSLSTENTYVSWIKQYILFHGKRHPAGIGVAEVLRRRPHFAVFSQLR